jgi:aspartyl-tRNA(Asn)/glutamyl-tRNA(Gln) amidotransferase subunit C
VAVSHDDVRRIADLARIAVPEARLDELARQLSGILAHMDALALVSDASAHEEAETSQAGMPLAKDAGPAVLLARGITEFGPQVREGFFLVPRLATHESAGDT